MNTLSNSPIQNLMKLKSVIDRKGQNGLSLYAEGEKCNFSAQEVNAMRKLGAIIRSDKPLIGRKYKYRWNENVNPNLAFLEILYDEVVRLNKIQSEKNRQKKLAKTAKKTSASGITRSLIPVEEYEAKQKKKINIAMHSRKVADDSTITVKTEVIGDRKTVTIKINL